jgi:hypothetical protein
MERQWMEVDPVSKEKTKEAFEEALREHSELRDSIEEMRKFLEGPRPEIGQKGYHTWASDLSGRLVGLHDKLFRHFRNEEETGVLKDLERLAPQATSKISAFEGEHGEILAGVRDVMNATLSYSVGEEPLDPKLRQRIRMILDQTAEHERAETDLIQDLLYSDLGEAG